MDYARQFAPEFRQRALRMLEVSISEHETEYVAIRRVSTKLGVGPKTLRKWRRRAEAASIAAARRFKTVWNSGWRSRRRG